MERNWILLQEKEEVTIVFSERENSAVKIAVSNLAVDIKRVCSCRAEIKGFGDVAVSSLLSKKNIVIASLDIYESIERDALWEKKPDIGLLLGQAGQRRWEGYLHQVLGNTLYIIGADRRGTVFGIYDLCEQMGVSPWYYWADVPAKRKRSFALPADYCKADWPGVPYRGIFLNDEEELEAWAKLHTKDGTIGPETYRHIFELLLRLKGNYIWPAMHVNFFNENPENGRLAEEMGIVVGTTHCDMLLRSNQNEWKPWLKQKGYTDIRYDYSIPGKNREAIREYWAESVEMNRDYEVSYTVGMRGIHDSGFVTEKIDQNAALTREQKQEEKVRLLGQVIADQQQIIKGVLGEEKGSHALQAFVPYKEVLELYDKGLQVPENVTLIWVDDNFGHVRRYPTGTEQGRPGGNGLYYHASYWAAPGMSYLFFNSIPLAQTGNELKKCWESGIRKLWVLNVGALKPLELDTEFFLWYGWNAGKEGQEMDALRFTEEWAGRNFSGGHGQAIGRVYHQCMQLTNVCKLEHMQSGKFSQTAYGNEAKKRLEELERLYQEASALYLELPAEERDAFYEMLLMKIHASYYINASFYYADRSRLCYGWGAMQAADAFMEMSKEMDGKKRRMLHYYNREILDGKWDGILTPESFSPPPTALYPAGKPALVIGEPELGVEGVDPVEFSPFGEKEQGIHVFNKGKGEVSFAVTGPCWLEISPKRGTVRTEREIRLKIREEEREAAFQNGLEGELLVRGGLGEAFVIALRCKKAAGGMEGEERYIEGDGFISIPAAGYDAGKNSVGAGWRKIPGLGRGFGDAMEAYAGDSAGNVFFEKDIMEAPRLDYLFALQSEGSFLLEIYRFLTMNATGRIRLAIGIDGQRPIVMESVITDEWADGWKEAVMNNGEKMYLQMPYLLPGKHCLSLFMVDRYVTITKLVIYTKKKLASNLGPLTGETKGRLAYGEKGKTGEKAGEKEIPKGKSWEEERQERKNWEKRSWEGRSWEELEKQIYPSLETPLCPLPMLYADPSFWEIDRLYVRSDAKEQERLGRIKYQPDADGGKNVFSEFGNGILAEENGKLSIEAEFALENSVNAYLTPDVPGGEIFWSHTQAETDGGYGLAMMLEGSGQWRGKEESAPGMHYRIWISNPGRYTVWLLVKFDDPQSDACRLMLDGQLQRGEEQFSRGNLFTYSMKQRWNWQAISYMDLPAGLHTFSILGKKAGLRIDRIYLTKGKERPPIDMEWEGSRRFSLSHFSRLNL